MDRIDKLAIDVRERLGIPEDERPDLLDTLRRARIYGLIDDFRPATSAELGRDAARWDQPSRSILILEEYWDALEDSLDPQLRFTVFHELGHATLNHATRSRRIGGAIQFGGAITREEDEADLFALAFAVPLTFVPTTEMFDADQLAERFGLSPEMAELRMVDLQMHHRQLVKATASAAKASESATADEDAQLDDILAHHRFVATKDEDWDF